MSVLKAVRGFFLLSLLTAGVPAVAHAQTPLRVERFPAATPQKTRIASVPSMAAGGLVGGAIGLIVFGYLGAVIADDPDSSEDLDALGGFVLGGALGEATMLPLGVHLVNRRQGNYAASMLASVGIVVAGLGLAFLTEDQAPLPGIILAAIPVAQLTSSIVIERRTSR